MPSPPRGPIATRIPPGDTCPRQVCDSCGFVHYVNPRMVVGALCLWDDKILLCRRAIEPRLGFWTLPAGYLELHESTEEAARRESHEEACAEIEIEALLAIYALRHISQVQLIYLARLLNADIAPGPESAEVALFGWDELAARGDRLSQRPLGARPVRRGARERELSARHQPARRDRQDGRRALRVSS